MDFDAKDLLINIYQEILKNEWGLMRVNYIVSDVDSIKLKNSELYVTKGDVTTPNVNRNIDLAVLVYGILMGILKSIHDSNLNNISRENVIETFNNRIKLVINFLKNQIRPELLENNELFINEDAFPKNEDPIVQMAKLLSALIKIMIVGGIIHIVKHNKESIYPIRMLYQIYNNKGGISIENSLDFSSNIAVYDILENIRQNNLDLNLGEFFNILDIIGNDIINWLGFEIVRLYIGNDGIKRSSNIPPYLNLRFKTSHGELIRNISITGALPSRPSNYEVLLPPFLSEPLADYTIEWERLKPYIINYLGNTQPLAESISEIIIKAFKMTFGEKLSTYQFNFIKDMLSGSNGFLAFITAPTGSGKTIVFTFFAIIKVLKEKLERLKNRDHKNKKVVMIYPRKALARDQLGKIITVLYYINNQLNKLDENLNNISLFIRDGDSPKKENLETPKSLRNISINITEGDKKISLRIEHYFEGNKYHAFLVDENSNYTEIDWIRDSKDTFDYDYNEYAFDIIITNMSMFSKLISDAFNYILLPKYELDTRKVSSIKLIDTIILDEAHVYLPYDQLSFTFHTLNKFIFIKFFDEFYDRYDNDKYYDENIDNIDDYETKIDKILKDFDLSNKIKSLNFLISSATISNKQIFAENTLTYTIIGTKQSPSRNNTVRSFPKELEKFGRALLGLYYQVYLNSGKIIYRDYYNDMKDSKKWRLKIFVLTYPTPDRRSTTSLNETILTVAHWILGNKNRLEYMKKASFLVFMDTKIRINEVTKMLWRRQVLDAKDICDRVLLTELFDKNMDNRIRIYALSEIGTILRGCRSNNKSMLECYLNDIFYKYSQISFYYPPKELYKMKLEKNSLKNTHIYKTMSFIIETANNFSKYNFNPEALDELIKENKFETLYPLFIANHHAGLTRASRELREEKIRSGHLLGMISTSTLEIGVDIDGCLLVIQFGSKTPKESLTQRIGRSGRSWETYRVSTGIIVLRNTGEDMSLINEENAINYVLNLEIPEIEIPLYDYNTTRRYLRMILKEFMDFYYSENLRKYNIRIDQSVKENIINTIRLFTLLVYIPNTYSKYNSLISEISNDFNLIKDSHNYVRKISNIDKNQYISNLKSLINDILFRIDELKNVLETYNESLKNYDGELYKLLDSIILELDSLNEDLEDLLVKTYLGRIFSLFKRYRRIDTLKNKLYSYYDKDANARKNFASTINIQRLIELINYVLNKLYSLLILLRVKSIIDMKNNISDKKGEIQKKIKSELIIDKLIRNMSIPKIPHPVTIENKSAMMIDLIDLKDPERGKFEVRVDWKDENEILNRIISLKTFE